MDKHTFDLLYGDVLTALGENRLLDAIHSLQGLVAFTGNWDCKNSLVEIEESYGMLLDYMSRGFEDPDRTKLFQQFLSQTYEVCDITYRDYLLTDVDSHYATVWSILRKMSQPASLRGLLEKGGSYRQLFEVAWTSPIWEKGDYEAAHDLMTSDLWRDTDKCVLLSGVTLGALQIFDLRRLKFLLDFAVSPKAEFRIRATVGALLVYLKHYQRCQFYPEIGKQWELMADIQGFASMLQALQTQLFLSLETKKIEKSLQEEILPEVMKKAQEIRLDKSLGFEELQEKLSDQELNPEWDKDGKVSELNKRVKELAEMQMKGADVYMGSFKMFKQKFPFFNVAANWFCPFSFTHPDVAAIVRDNAFLKMFLSSGSLCDSDKYSFCLMMQGMPAVENDILRQQIGDAMSGHEDVLQTMETLDPERKSVHLLRSYIQDLYRFFTLFRYQDIKQNPFAMNLLLTDYKPFDTILSNETTLQELADFTFKEKSYLYALNFYQHLPESAENYQKIGFCHQSVKNYHEAICAYEKANLLKSDSVWTLRQLGNCYRSLGDFSKAMHVFEEVEAFAPEDVSLLLRLSECYLHEKMYDRAFSKLYKAYYLAPDSKMALRALAWCSLLTGQMEKSCDYYQKIIEGAPMREDYLNAGHATWLRGDVPKAVSYYREVLALDKVDFAPVNFFGDDEKVLLGKGKSSLDLRLMIDILNKR